MRRFQYLQTGLKFCIYIASTHFREVKMQPCYVATIPSSLELEAAIVCFQKQCSTSTSDGDLAYFYTISIIDKAV